MKWRLMDTDLTDLTVTTAGPNAIVVLSVYSVDEFTNIKTRSVQVSVVVDAIDYEEWALGDPTAKSRETLVDAPVTKLPVVVDVI